MEVDCFIKDLKSDEMGMKGVVRFKDILFEMKKMNTSS